MARDRWRDILESATTGFVGGYSSGLQQKRQAEAEMAKEMWKQKLLMQDFEAKERIKQAIAMEDPEKFARIQALGLATGSGMDGGGFRRESFTAGGQTFERVPTEEELQKESDIKAQAQAKIAAAKEKQVNISKVSRLSTMANVIENEWMKTQPKGGIRGRVSGLMSIPQSFAQGTPQQQVDSAYRTFVKGMRAQLARAMGDVGNLSEPEQQAAMALVPSLGDNIETGKRKISIIREFVRAIKEGSLETARGILQEHSPQGLNAPSGGGIPSVGQMYGGERVVGVRRVK